MPGVNERAPATVTMSNGYFLDELMAENIRVPLGYFTHSTEF